jgi:DNA adenine methylase
MRSRVVSGTPFLKWAGGKGRLAPLIVERAPAFERYHEPFLGGGAVFFALCAAGKITSARLADGNRELIECYLAVRNEPGALIATLGELSAAYLDRDRAGRSAFYYDERARQPGSAVERAARLIFLNRTCYNGLYRVNASGRFNVPHGRYANPRILDEPGLRAVSACLQGAELVAEDFAAACGAAEPGDFVYLDPPYVPLSRTSSFTSYTSVDFGPGEQERLGDTFEELTRRGVAAMLSNSDHPFVRRLYEGRGYELEPVTMSRAINSVGSKRSPIPELLINNFARVGLG